MFCLSESKNLAMADIIFDTSFEEILGHVHFLLLYFACNGFQDASLLVCRVYESLISR